MSALPTPIRFQWDKGNDNRNLKKHGVSNSEAEEVFFDENKKNLQDPLHSKREKRYILLGKTQNQRCLFVIFTIRQNLIRIISARDLNKKEYPLYEKS